MFNRLDAIVLGARKLHLEARDLALQRQLSFVLIPHVVHDCTQKCRIHTVSLVVVIREVVGWNNHPLILYHSQLHTYITRLSCFCYSVSLPLRVPTVDRHPI